MVTVASSVSPSLLSLAVTVTVWPTFQLVAMKVSAPVTVTTPPAPAAGVMVTSPSGRVASTTV